MTKLLIDGVPIKSDEATAELGRCIGSDRLQELTLGYADSSQAPTQPCPEVAWVIASAALALGPASHLRKLEVPGYGINDAGVPRSIAPRVC